MSLLKMLLMNK